MSIIAKLIRAGVAPDLIDEVVQALVDAAKPAEQPLTARQARNKRYYEKRLKASETSEIKTPEGASENRLNASESVLNQTPLARGEDNLSRLEITGTTAAVAAEAREADDWPAGDARQHARLLIEAANSPWLDPSKSQTLVLTTGELDRWRRAGCSWNHAVEPVVLGMTAKARGQPIRSWKFFADAVAQAHAANSAALVIPLHERSHRNQPDPKAARYADRLADVDAAMRAAVQRPTG